MRIFLSQFVENAPEGPSNGRTLITATRENIDASEVADHELEHVYCRTVITKMEEQIDPSEEGIHSSWLSAGNR